MALRKEFVTPQGVIALYHKILKIEISAIDLSLVVVVALYPTEEVRDSGAPPLWHEYIKIPFGNLEADPREAFYNLISTHIDSYLTGAEDV